MRPAQAHRAGPRLEGLGHAPPGRDLAAVDVGEGPTREGSRGARDHDVNGGAVEQAPRPLDAVELLEVARVHHTELAQHAATIVRGPDAGELAQVVEGVAVEARRAEVRAALQRTRPGRSLHEGSVDEERHAPVASELLDHLRHPQGEVGPKAEDSRAVTETALVAGHDAVDHLVELGAEAGAGVGQPEVARAHEVAQVLDLLPLALVAVAGEAALAAERKAAAQGVENLVGALDKSLRPREDGLDKNLAARVARAIDVLDARVGLDAVVAHKGEAAVLALEVDDLVERVLELLALGRDLVAQVRELAPHALERLEVDSPVAVGSGGARVADEGECHLVAPFVVPLS